MVELSSKFGCDPGEAVDLIIAAFDLGLVAEGISFHVGSQCTNFQNFVQALNMAAAVMEESKSRGHKLNILDIGGGFPAPYNKHVKPFSALAKKINAEIDRLFPANIEIIESPEGFSSRPLPPRLRVSSVKQSAMANPATTLMTASTIPSAALYPTTVNIT